MQAKARILYFRALNDVISVTETVPADEPHRYGRLGKVYSKCRNIAFILNDVYC